MFRMFRMVPEGLDVPEVPDNPEGPEGLDDPEGPVGRGKAGTLMWLSFCFFGKKLQNVAVKIELQRHSVAKAQGKL